jgi:hypothetical protein
MEVPGAVARGLAAVMPDRSALGHSMIIPITVMTPRGTRIAVRRKLALLRVPIRAAFCSELRAEEAESDGWIWLWPTSRPLLSVYYWQDGNRHPLRAPLRILRRWLDGSR